MALSAAAPSLNRFPGLTLKAWVLSNGNTVIQQFNVSSVVSSLGSFTVNFTAPLTAGGYVMDMSMVAPSAYMISAYATYAQIALKDDTGTAASLSAPVFIAFYG